MQSRARSALRGLHLALDAIAVRCAMFLAYWLHGRMREWLPFMYHTILPEDLEFRVLRYRLLYFGLTNCQPASHEGRMAWLVTANPSISHNCSHWYDARRCPPCRLR